MIALCSSFKEALICVDIDGKQDFCTLPANCKHSENVLPCMDKCLQNIGKNINDNDCFAVVVGPGSFTGIRIGISLVKGFIAGNDKFKILPITSFELIAYNYIKNNIIDKDFYCAIDALSNRVFICKFDKDGKQIDSEKMISKEEYDKIKELTVGVVEENIAKERITLSPQLLLELSRRKERENCYVDVNELVPMYMRKSQAEESLKTN